MCSGSSAIGWPKALRSVTYARVISSAARVPGQRRRRPGRRPASASRPWPRPVRRADRWLRRRPWSRCRSPLRRARSAGSLGSTVTPWRSQSSSATARSPSSVSARYHDDRRRRRRPDDHRRLPLSAGRSSARAADPVAAITVASSLTRGEAWQVVSGFQSSGAPRMIAGSATSLCVREHAAPAREPRRASPPLRRSLRSGGRRSPSPPCSSGTPMPRKPCSPAERRISAGSRLSSLQCL